MRRALKLLFSLLVTAGFTWWAFRGTHWAELWQGLKTARYVWLIPYFALLLVIHVCRTLRWGHLLAGMERVPFGRLNEASGIGFMMLLVLPFRLGEFARPFLIAQRSGIRRSAAMTTVVLERIVNGLTVATLLRVLLFFIPERTPELRYVSFGSTLMFAIFGGGLAFLLFARWNHQRAVRAIQVTLGWMSPKLGERVAGMVDTFVGALRQLPPARDTVSFFLYTGAYWGLNGLGISMLSRAFGCDTDSAPGCVAFGLTAFQAYVVVSVLVVGLMIPAAPGMVGTFQAFIKIGLALFMPLSTVNGKGLAFANVLWLCQTAQQIALGLILMSMSHFSFRDLASKLEKGERPAPAG